MSGEESVPPPSPFAVQSEWSVVGAMLIGGPATVAEVSAILTESDFGDPCLGTAFRVICELTDAGNRVDRPMLRAALAPLYVRGVFEIDPLLSELADRTYTAAGAEWHAKKVRNASLMLRARGEIETLHIDARQWTGTALEFVENAQKRFLALDAAERGERGQTAVPDILPGVWGEMWRLYDNPEDDGNGLPTGLPTLDKYLKGGFKGGRLYILAARPGVGKTSLALSMGVHVAKRTRKDAPNPFVRVFSMEMSQAELLERMVFTEAEVDTLRLATHSITPQDRQNLDEAYKRIKPLHIDLEDDGGMTLSRLTGICRRAKVAGRLDLAIVDYTQLLSTGATGRDRPENRVQEISVITRGLKEMARTLDVPVLALSQLSRAVESRADKLPMLSDLRDSGSIEQDADAVMFLYPFDARGEIGSGANVPVGGDPEAAAGSSVSYALDVKKNRGGPTNKKISLMFWPEFTKFGEVAATISERF